MPITQKMTEASLPRPARAASLASVVLCALGMGGCGMVWRFEYTFPLTVAMEVRADVHTPTTQPATQPATQPGAKP